MSILSIENLSISFHGREGITRAVLNASFKLDKGETIAIVGESGSGKSVLCSSIMGLLPMPPARIENGTIEFQGQNILTSDNRQLRGLRGNRIGMVFQDPMTSLNPYLKIKNQITEPVCLHQRMTAKAAWPLAIAMLNEVGLPDPEQIMNLYPHQLSGGMRQRVMIAMALINKPDILIADEPTTALDVTIQSQILKLIKKLQREYNIAVIFVSHDLGVVAGIADHILVMQQGQIVEQGTPDNIFYKSQHPYTRNLLDSIPVRAKTEKFIANSADTKPLLTLQHLRTWYQSNDNELFRSGPNLVKAVDDVNLQIFPGETLGLVGESGSGKSTLGRSVMRLVQITDGKILLDDRNLAELSASELKLYRREFQMIFQDPYASLNPRMTIFDALSEALQIRGALSESTIHEEITLLMNDVGLDPASIRKYPHEFSGGQRQRIAIARAIALKPRLIIADEPVSALDVTIQAQILDLLLMLVKKNQLTMLFISHDLSVIRYMSDRVAVMYQGIIVETGDTESLFAQPAHPYTKTLLSAIPLPDPIRERARYRQVNVKSSEPHITP